MDTNRKCRLLLIWATVVAATIVLSMSSVAAQDAGAGTTDADKTAGDDPAKAGQDTATTGDGNGGGGRKDVTQPKPGFFKELHIRSVEIRGALEMLNSQVKKNIIITMEVTGTVTADMYNVSFDEALKGILTANGLAHTVQGNFIYVMTIEQKAKLTKVERKQSVQMFRLSYINAADARAVLAPLLSETGEISMTPAAVVGIETSTTEAGGNSLAISDVLIIRDFDDNLRRISTVINELDVRPDQVLIEATLLRARLSEDNALGVDFNVLSGIDFNTLGGTTDGLQSITTTAVPAAVKHQAWTFRTDFNSAVPTGGLTFGFMSNNVGVFVRALEGITDVNVMANPKLLVVNKMRGEVMVGRKDGYMTTTFTETTASQTVEFLETGTKLVVRPFIGRDGYVRLEIHPKDSSGSVTQVGTAALPSETTTEVTTNVLVRDGHTIVIGGLFREETSAGRSQTPLIGNVPYIGALFRNTTDSTRREEVIILITPRIIRQGADEAIGEQLRDDVERFRLGARNGIRWWGRSRLAQARVRNARAALANGDRDKALWHLDAALSLRPNQVEAINLKERLTNRAYWADVTQESSARFIIQRMIMNELGKATERVILRRKPLNGKGLGDDVKKAFGIGPRIQDPLNQPPSDNGDDSAAAKDDDKDDASKTPAAIEVARDAADDDEAKDPAGEADQPDGDATDDAADDAGDDAVAVADDLVDDNAAAIEQAADDGAATTEEAADDSAATTEEAADDSADGAADPTPDGQDDAGQGQDETGIGMTEGDSDQDPPQADTTDEES